MRGCMRFVWYLKWPLMTLRSFKVFMQMFSLYWLFTRSPRCFDTFCSRNISFDIITTLCYGGIALTPSALPPGAPANPSGFETADSSASGAFEGEQGVVQAAFNQQRNWFTKPWWGNHPQIMTCPSHNSVCVVIFFLVLKYPRTNGRVKDRRAKSSTHIPTGSYRIKIVAPAWQDHQRWSSHQTYENSSWRSGCLLPSQTVGINHMMIYSMIMGIKDYKNRTCIRMI